MTERNKFWWMEYCIECIHTGSRVICSPPPTNTDDDYMLLVDIGIVPKLEEELLKDGYKLGGSFKVRMESGPLKEYPSVEELTKEKGNVFHSYKKDVLNVIITASPEYYVNFKKATSLAIELNLLYKDARVALFHAICTDDWPLYSIVCKKRNYGL